MRVKFTLQNIKIRKRSCLLVAWSLNKNFDTYFSFLVFSQNSQYWNQLNLRNFAPRNFSIVENHKWIITEYFGNAIFRIYIINIFHNFIAALHRKFKIYLFFEIFIAVKGLIIFHLFIFFYFRSIYYDFWLS